MTNKAFREQGLQQYVNELSYGVEPSFIRRYPNKPMITLSQFDAFQNKVGYLSGLLHNQTGHLDNTVRGYISAIMNNDPGTATKIIGLSNQIELGRYRFLNHPNNSLLVYAKEMELEALSHPAIPNDVRNDLLLRLQNTLSLLE